MALELVYSTRELHEILVRVASDDNVQPSALLPWSALRRALERLGSYEELLSKGMAKGMANYPGSQ